MIVSVVAAAVVGVVAGSVPVFAVDVGLVVVDSEVVDNPLALTGSGRHLSLSS